MLSVDNDSTTLGLLQRLLESTPSSTMIRLMHGSRIVDGRGELSVSMLLLDRGQGRDVMADWGEGRILSHRHVSSAGLGRPAV